MAGGKCLPEVSQDDITSHLLQTESGGCSTQLLDTITAMAICVETFSFCSTEYLTVNYERKKDENRQLC